MCRRRGRSAALATLLLCAAVAGCERTTSGTLPAGVATGASTPAAGPIGKADRPSVLLVVVDTLRADYLPVYGSTWGRTPSLDRLAADGVVFERAVAAAAATVPSHASIFTSRFVRQHSIGSSNGGTKLGGETTLAGRFRSAGYATAGFVSNVMLSASTGLGRGFDLYDDHLPKQEPNRPLFFEREARETTQRAVRWLKRAGDQPVFLLVHYQNPHGPYTPPEHVLRAIATREPAGEPTLSVNEGQSGQGGIPAYQAIPGLNRPSQYERRYQAEILFMDRWLGPLLHEFDAHREGAGHIVLFTADHGESFGENDHWFEHGHATTPDIAHVPFLLRAPGIAAGRVGTPVSHVDILPTLLELAGLPVPTDARGIALGPYLREGRDLPSRELYCDLGTEAAVYDERGFTRVRFPSVEAATGGDVRRATVERFRWTGDATWLPSPEQPVLGGEARSYLSDVKTPRPATMLRKNPGRVERLRALGYLEPAGD